MAEDRDALTEAAADLKLEDAFAAYASRASTAADGSSAGVAAPAEPPAMAQKREVTADELWNEMQRHPLFMTSLDDADGAEGSNELLESLKALAYEGTKAEVALNFKTQGNECVATKQWADAREFYTKGIQTIRGLIQTHEAEFEDEPEMDIVAGSGGGKVLGEVDEEAEAKQERQIEEQCLVNRARCQLEMKNYGSCNRDCAAALKLNPRNVKAWYRAASACLALDKCEEAQEACEMGLKYDGANAALQTLRGKVAKRRTHLDELERTRRQRLEREAKESAARKLALKSRNIPTRTTTATPPNMEDAAIALANPVDPASALTFPIVLLYPLEAQSDFIKSCGEGESIGEHLSYILPPPWDAGGAGEYANPELVECYMETAAAGLIKAGKKMSLLRLLSSGKVEVVDGLVSVNVVPKARAAAWIEEFKRRKGKQ